MLCLRSARLSCAFLGLSIAPAFATVVTFSDITAWQNATAPGFTTITFEGLAPGGYASFTTGLVIGDGTKFDSWPTSGSLNVYNQTPGPSSYFNFGSGAVLAGPTCCVGSYINITLPRPVTSASFDIMTVGGNGISFIATLNNLVSTNYTSAPTLPWSSTNPPRAFFGFTTTADTPITNIYLSLPPSASGIYPILDNFRYGDTPNDTPEACTLLLIGSGLIGMSVFRRRLRRVAAAVAV
jgi:hypothetical protein